MGRQVGRDEKGKTKKEIQRKERQVRKDKEGETRMQRQERKAKK